MTAAPGQGSQGALGFVTVTFSSTLTFVQYETTQTRWSLQVTGTSSSSIPTQGLLSFSQSLKKPCGF